MFQRFTNPTVLYTRRIQSSLDEARMAALEHESAAEHHQALANMYRDRVRRLQGELAELNGENLPVPKTVTPIDEQAAASAAQVRLIAPRSGNQVTGNGGKRDEGGVSGGGFVPQGAAG